MIDYLINFSCRHWDKGVRDLASEALFKFTEYDPDYFIEDVIERLVRAFFPKLRSQMYITLIFL